MQVQHLGGEGSYQGFPVNPDYTRYYPASLNVGRFTWGVWTSKTGNFYIKTAIKVEKVPGKENSDKAVAQIDRSGSGDRFDLPKVKDLENGIWTPVVIEVKNAPGGAKEYGFQATNKEDIYTLHYGPWVVIDTNPDPLELTDEQKAQNDARRNGTNEMPNYQPANFSTETGFVYKFTNVTGDNYTHSPRAYMTVTPNGNYLTTKRDFVDWFVWNGYMDRLGRTQPLPKGRYYFVYAFKAEGVAYDRDLGNDAQDKNNPALGLMELPGLAAIRFGSEAEIDGKWHVKSAVVNFESDIPVNKEFRIRNFFNSGTFALSVGPVYIMPYQDMPAISLNKTVYTAGEDIKITFSNLDKTTLISGKNVSGMKIVKADGTDVEEGVSYWIDFPDKDRNINNPNGSYTYKFTTDGQNGNFKTLSPGQYKMRLQASGQEEIMSVSFTIVEDASVAEVVNAINNLPDEIKLSDEEAIVAARNKYNALSAGQKEQVSQDILAKLEAAENALAELKKPETTPPATEPVTPPPTGDIFPAATLVLFAIGTAGSVIFKKKDN